jgi:hypothetical protein
MWSPLTSDNLQLSRPKMGDMEGRGDGLIEVSEAVRE